MPQEIFRNPEGVAIRRMVRNPFRVATTSKSFFVRVAAKRGNPGLKLANAFSVKRIWLIARTFALTPSRVLSSPDIASSGDFEGRNVDLRMKSLLVTW